MNKNKEISCVCIRTTPLRRIGGVEVQLYRRLKYLFVNSDRLRASVGFTARKKLLVHRLVTGEKKPSVAAWESNQARQDS
jgi:hypothetical protein